MLAADFNVQEGESEVPETPSVAEMVGDWIKRTFSRRKQCYVFFHYEERGPDLRLPIRKVQPYVAYCRVKPTAKEIAPLFACKAPKGRTIKIIAVVIQPVGRIQVV